MIILAHGGGGLKCFVRFVRHFLGVEVDAGCHGLREGDFLGNSGNSRIFFGKNVILGLTV